MKRWMLFAAMALVLLVGAVDVQAAEKGAANRVRAAEAGQGDGPCLTALQYLHEFLFGDEAGALHRWRWVGSPNGSGEGYGPGDGTGTGAGPRDGSGNGPGDGDCDNDGVCDGSGPN